MIKRIYDDPSNDGGCVLVDRLWQRGLPKEEAPFTAWIKEVPPSDDLRTRDDLMPRRWRKFRECYLAEL